LTTRWKELFLYPYPFSPVAAARKQPSQSLLSEKLPLNCTLVSYNLTLMELKVCRASMFLQSLGIPGGETHSQTSASVAKRGEHPLPTDQRMMLPSIDMPSWSISRNYVFVGPFSLPGHALPTVILPQRPFLILLDCPWEQCMSQLPCKLSLILSIASKALPE